MESDLTTLCKAEALSEELGDAVEMVDLSFKLKPQLAAEAVEKAGLEGKTDPSEEPEAAKDKSKPSELEVQEKNTSSRPHTSSEAAANSTKDTKTGRIGPVLLYALIVCLGGVLGGYSHGFPSPTLLDLEEAYQQGERVNAFQSSSIYAGLFGVS